MDAGTPDMPLQVLSLCAAGAVPADLLLACGIFGNSSADSIRHAITCFSSLCVARAVLPAHCVWVGCDVDEPE